MSLMMDDGARTSSSTALTGPFTLATLSKSIAMLEGRPAQGDLDISGITALDTAGAWALLSYQTTQKVRGRAVVLVNATAAQDLLLQTVAEAMPTQRVRRRRPPHHHAGDWLARLGQTVAVFAAGMAQSIGFFGLVVSRLAATLRHPARLRVTSMVHHMQQTGLDAVPIVALMGVLIGVVLAYQGASQLKQFGAEVFVVDLIAISILRELGILLTAIIVAGRSASAFTAALGSMKMREEIDAMRVLGLDPIDLLVLPRVLALLITLPLLGFIASIAGILGGGMMVWFELGISPEMFRIRLLADTSVSHALVGLSKAPVFAVIIGIVGCYQGMQVEGNTDSLGSRTSRSVVIAIFLVIVVDAVFSIFFAVWGV